MIGRRAEGLARGDVELGAVPGTEDPCAANRAVAQGSALVGALGLECVEFAVHVEQSDALANLYDNKPLMIITP